VPAFVGREALGGERELGREPALELVVGELEEREELADHHAHVLRVDERVRELERAPADGDVAVAEAVEDRVPVPLHGRRVERDDLGERGERDVPDVVVPVREELAEDVDREHAQARVGLDLEDREHGLVQHRVPHVLARVRVRRDLREDVVHRVARRRVAPPQDPHQPQDLDLEERVRDPRHVVLGAVARRDERLERTHEQRNRLRTAGERAGAWGGAGRRTLRNSARHAASIWHISVTSVMAVSRTPWLRSVSRFFALATKWSASSGTRLSTRSAHSAACGRVSRRRGHGGRAAHLLADVRVARAEQLLDLVREVARHLFRRDVRERAEREPARVHVRVVHVAGAHARQPPLPSHTSRTRRTS
jgi:hypothetical protein